MRIALATRCASRPRPLSCASGASSGSARVVPILLGLLLVLCSDCSPRGDSTAEDPGRHLAEAAPNLLLLSIDTLRPDYLSFNGYDRDTTPFIDSLLAEGVYFDRATTPVPRTTPALASLMTGRYPHSTGVRRLADRLPEASDTLAVLATRAGYNTIAVVSNHMLTPERNLGIGFEIYDASGDERDAKATTETALAHIRSRPQHAPLLLWVHYIDPHVPYWPSTTLAEDFDPTYGDRYRHYFGSIRGGTGRSAYPEDLGKIDAVFRNRLPDAVNAHIRRLYAADIRMTDDAIRALVESLREEIAGEWLIVLTADHGESLGEHDFFYDHGDYVYNATLRVPLAFVGDAQPTWRPGRIATPVSLVDVLPTLVDVLSLAPSDEARGRFEGRSLAAALAGEPLASVSVFAESGFSYYPSQVRRRTHNTIEGRFRAVTSGEWKLIYTPGQRPELRYELYRLSEDPHEERDLYAPDHPALPALRRELARWMGGAAPSELLGQPDPRPPSRADEGSKLQSSQPRMTPEDREKLRILGYTE